MGTKADVVRPYLCPFGGTVERPGISAITVARAVGEAPGQFVLHGCDHGQEPVSGTARVTLRREAETVVPVGFTGTLRLHAAPSRICGLALAHDPTEDAPWRHVGELCGEAGAIGGPAPLRGANPSGMLGAERP